MDKFDFVIAVLDGSLGASVGATLDVLDFAHRVSTGLGRAGLRWRLIGSAARVRLSNGLTLPAEPLAPGMDLGRSVLVIPGLGLDGLQDADGSTRRGIEARYADAAVLQRLAMPDAQPLAQLARAHADRGGRLGASCSGVLVLGEAGLLAGRRVTTHWKLAGLLRRHFAHARLDPACMVVEDGRIVTAGAAMAQLDLMLHLLRQIAGREVAEPVMRHLLIDTRASQARYMVWQQLDGGHDDIVRRFEALVESGLPGAIGVAEAAKRLNLTAKTLARRVAKATGGSPRDLIQAVRMRQAQRLLEMTELPVDEIAARVGYANATSLRKLTLKMTRLTPASLRRPTIAP